MEPTPAPAAMACQSMVIEILCFSEDARFHNEQFEGSRTVEKFYINEKNIFESC